MDQQIIDRYSEAVLQEAMQRYGIRAGNIHLLGTVESFVYEYERDGSSYILRLGHSLHRSEALIQGELDWINYLAAGGVSVARAVYSDSGRLVEKIEDDQGGYFLATAFVKANGRSPWDVGWSPALYEEYGKLLGQIHALSSRYVPGNPTYRRPAWDADLFEFVERYLPPSEAIAKAKYRALCDYLHTLPTDSASYGLIHQDAHGSNFFVDDAGCITLFDFDECAYSWFVNDVAIALFYTVMDAEDWPAFTGEFMTHFLRGYRQAFPISAAWLKQIPYFLKLREIELYAVIYREYKDVNDISGWWDARFMRGRKEKIEHDIPYIDFDFETAGGFSQ